MDIVTQRLMVVGAVAGLATLGACLTAATGAEPAGPRMGFFITSTSIGRGGDLGGLNGADAHCQKLATAAGAGDRTWRAYLSAAAADGSSAVDARDRIGTGPWYNARGVMVARDLADLHSPNNLLGKANSLTETGATVNGRGDTPNQHDILTGSTEDGRLAPPVSPPPPVNPPAGYAPPAPVTNLTCDNWTSSGPGRSVVGHFDRQGGGQSPTSWNSAHQTRSCSQPDLIATGGNGYFYCFAAD